MTPMRLRYLISLVLMITLAQPLLAEEWGVVTIQSTYSYGYTYPLLPTTVPSLQRTKGSTNVHVADDKNNSNVGRVLGRLKDGDVLVINTHSSTGGFGVGNRLPAWSKFYRTFGVRPFRPRLVIIHGCIANYDADNNPYPSTDSQINAIRQALGADAIVSYNTEIDPRVARISLEGIIEGVSKGKPIASLIKGANVRFITAPGVNRDKVTVNDLGTPAPVIPPPPSPTITSLNLSSVLAVPESRTLASTETVVEVTVQFTATGIPSGHADTIRYSGQLQAPDGTSKAVSGSFSIPGGGYQAGGFKLKIPNSAPEGDYSLPLTITGGSASASGTGKFRITYPNLAYSMNGPASVKEGDAVQITAQVTNGVPPYRWQWSGGGQSGSGSALTFSPKIGSATAPSVDFTVNVWDGAHNAATPLVRTHKVKVDKKALELKVSISGPTETAEGRRETITADASGGQAPYRFEWTTPWGAVSGKTVIHDYTNPITHDLQVAVFDQGTHKTSPKTAVYSIKVYPKLKGSIAGPLKARPGQRIQLAADPVGGKPTYTYLWTSASGKQSTKPAVSGKLNGKSGDERRITLEIEDSLNPPQRLHLEQLIKVVEPKLQISKIVVSPRALEPGGSAKVTVFFQAQDIDPNAKAQVVLWMESSSGSGRGATRRGEVDARAGQASANHPTDANGKEGPLQVAAKVTIGGDTQTARTTATLKKAIDVREAQESNFLGIYALGDPARTRKQYSGHLKLYANGKGRVKEWQNGKPITPKYPRTLDGQGYLPVTWSYREGVFTLDFTCGGRLSGLGRFSGSVTGTTNNFVLSGHWAGGGAGRLRFQRR
jgi:hypothetical protein